jgi:hypothetical protein
MLSSVVKTELYINIHDPVLIKEQEDRINRTVKKFLKQFGTNRCKCGKIISMNKETCLECKQGND